MDYKAVSLANNVFITGATGVLGARLLSEILQVTNAVVYCLMTDDSREEATKRLKKMLAVYDPEHNLDKEFESRVVPLLGDLTLDNLGFEDNDYVDLAESIDLVFHCAANVNLIASYEKLAPVNVGGTANIIEFCLSGNIPLLFTSSYSVIGDKLYEKSFVFKEDDLDVGQGFEDLNYEKTKFEAEKLIQKSTKRGLVWTIVRPGNIWGDSETGCYPLYETKVRGIYYEILKTLIDTGYCYPSAEAFDVTPVDYVAQACLYIALHINKTNGQTYHLTNPQPVSQDGFVKQVIDCGYQIRELSAEDYFTALYEERMVVEGKPYRSTYTDFLMLVVDDDLPDEEAVFDTEKVRGLLQNSDIHCAHTDKNLMQIYTQFAVDKGWISSAESQEPLAEIIEEMENKIFMQHLYDENLLEAV